MALRPAAFAAAALVLLLGVSLGGCLTVFPAKSLLMTDPRGSSLVFENRLAYEAIGEPEGGCVAGSDSRPIYVPERSQRVTVFVQAHITSIPPEFASVDPRHFDLTITDGANLVWVDVHLRNNDSQEEVVVDGPRPGAWTVTISWEICEGNFIIVKANDQFRVQVVVRQPV